MPNIGLLLHQRRNLNRGASLPNKNTNCLWFQTNFISVNCTSNAFQPERATDFYESLKGSARCAIVVNQVRRQQIFVHFRPFRIIPRVIIDGTFLIAWISLFTRVRVPIECFFSFSLLVNIWMYFVSWYVMDREKAKTFL